MKSLAIFALSTLAAASAFALTQTPNGEITISGTSTQTASVTGGSHTNNQANGSAYANQNLASNKGSIVISGVSDQTASVSSGSNVSNLATKGGDVAVQNLASNVGAVTVGPLSLGGTIFHPVVKGKSEQSVSVANGSGMYNTAEGDGCGDNCHPAATAIAYQSASSNFGDVTITGNSKQSTGIADGSTAWNLAQGGGAVALQNMSSNYGTVDISGKSTQTTWIAGGSTVGNFANGAKAVAYQNLASNDSCEPPPTVCVGPACGPFASR